MTKTEIRQGVRERWCGKCDDFRIGQIKQWETSIAVIYDLICPTCHEIFDRYVKKKTTPHRRLGK